MAIKFDRDQTFATNGTVTAAALHNLVDGLDIYQALITDQTALTSVSTADSLLIADSDLAPGDQPRKTTVQNLFDDALTTGTYTDAHISDQLTAGTATFNRTVSTSATITTGTIPTLVSTSATITTGTIPILVSTSATITTGTIPTLVSTTGTIATFNSTTGTIAGLNSTTGTIATLNSTTGTISNLSTTLAGDFTISQGTGTLGTSGVTLGTYGGSTSIPTIVVDAKGRVTTASTSAFSSSQQFSISASVASNAITVTLQPSSIDFRNTTLTTGGVTTVTNSTAITLTIASSDSFGAVTADGNRRIAILAINNGGTVELAASSLAGGVQLDETNVITTAATATALTTIKAANVRTNVAYRVVGFIDCPFTTSTGWGSLVVVQGCGGQAMTGMSSLGYGQTWQTVTGSRLLNTTYYNTTGKPIAIRVTSNSAAAGINITINGVSDPASFFQYGAGHLIIPVANSYLINFNGASLSTWQELR